MGDYDAFFYRNRIKIIISSIFTFNYYFGCKMSIKTVRKDTKVIKNFIKLNANLLA